MTWAQLPGHYRERLFCRCHLNGNLTLNLAGGPYVRSPHRAGCHPCRAHPKNSPAGSHPREEHSDADDYELPLGEYDNKGRFVLQIERLVSELQIRVDERGQWVVQHHCQHSPEEPHALGEMVSSIPGRGDIISEEEIVERDKQEEQLDSQLLADVPHDAVVPAWDEVCATLVEALQATETAVDVTVNWNASNVLEVINIAIDFCNMASVPFDKSVGWFEEGSEEEDAAMVSSWELPSWTSSFTFFFIVAVVCAVVYPPVAYYGANRVFEGKLGLDEAGHMATLNSKEYW